MCVCVCEREDKGVKREKLEGEIGKEGEERVKRKSQSYTDNPLLRSQTLIACRKAGGPGN